MINFNDLDEVEKLSLEFLYKKGLLATALKYTTLKIMLRVNRNIYGEAMTMAFNWGDTDEGYYFWLDITDEMVDYTTERLLKVPNQ